MEAVLTENSSTVGRVRQPWVTLSYDLVELYRIYIYVKEQPWSYVHLKYGRIAI